MADELKFNKKIAVVKLLLSSLFARKQNFLVVNGRKRNQLYFTTITSDRALFYKPDKDDQLMSVRLTEKAASILYDIFPVFKDTIAVFQLNKFLSMMNKKLAAEKGVAPVPIINQETGEITFTVPAGIGIDDLFKTPRERSQYLRGENGCLVGHLIHEDNFAKYEAIMAFHNRFVPEPVDREITIAQAYANDRVILVNIELPNYSKDCKVCLNLPVQDGTNIVSFKEYLTKRKAKWQYIARIQYNEKYSVAKVAYMHSDEYVDVECISPGGLWFPFKKV